MINRQNWLDVRKHLDYRVRVLQNERETARAAWVALRHLLEWADAVPFPEVEKIKVTFPEYVLTARNDGIEKPLSPKYMGKIIDNSRYFFTWAKNHLPGYKRIPDSWIETLKLRRSKSQQSKLTTRTIWTIEDIRQILSTPNPRDDSLRYSRDKAALAFLFLSGMRAGAFVTLPLSCVDVSRRRIKQLPEMGVHTKNSKAAVTPLIPIPDLLEVVNDWDSFLRSEGADDRAAWYVHLGYNGLTINKNDLVQPGENYHGRYSALVQGIRRLCELADVPYRSPHKIRHGFGVYGVKHAGNMAQLKAISQAMMHSNVGITDGIYGRLPDDDAFDQITEMFTDR